MDVVAGINEKDLANLIIEIANTADKINVVLNKYDDKFAELKNFYQGKPYEKIEEYYNSFVRIKFNTIKNNIISYSNDLTALNRKMHEGAKSMSDIFAQKTDDVNAVTKRVNNYVEGLIRNDN